MPAYQDGHLLLRGGWSDQPARYVELVQLMVSLERQSQEKYDDLTTEDGAD